MVYTFWKAGRRKERRKKESGALPKYSIIGDDLLPIFTMMRRRSVKKVLALLVDRPGLTLKELSDALKLRRKETCACVRKLYAIGLITRKIEDKVTRYHIKGERNVRIIRAIDSLQDKN